MKNDTEDILLTDPLHEILERHLFRSSTEGEFSEELVKAVIADYMQFLQTQGVHTPAHLKAILIEDLADEIKEIIVKKTYGAVRIESGVDLVKLTGDNSTRKTIRKVS